MSKPVSIKEIDPEILLYKRETKEGPEFRMVLSGSFNTTQKRWRVWVADPVRGLVQETNLSNEMGRWETVSLVTSDNVNKIVLEATKPLIDRIAALEAKLNVDTVNQPVKRGRGRPRKSEAVAAE
tara:strand:+ start:1408 stop:1782 length:375 start_codon:yes stop_codon:yes gene_type:complete